MLHKLSVQYNTVECGGAGGRCNSSCLLARVGNGISFKKNREIDSERFPLFRGRKCSLGGITRSTEVNSDEKNFFYKTAKNLYKMSSPFLKSCLFWHFFFKFSKVICF
jgi:hypothetical protein